MQGKVIDLNSERDIRRAQASAQCSWLTSYQQVLESNIRFYFALQREFVRAAWGVRMGESA